MAILSILEPVNHTTIDIEEIPTSQPTAENSKGFLSNASDRERWNSAF